MIWSVFLCQLYEVLAICANVFGRRDSADSIRRQELASVETHPLGDVVGDARSQEVAVFVVGPIRKPRLSKQKETEQDPRDHGKHVEASI
jgi:hypothetical protein